MFRRPFVVYFMSAVLGALFTQQAVAWGTGGSVRSPFKLLPGLTLFCDLSDPRSTAQILSTPCPDGCVEGDFIFEGPMVCAEIPADPDILQTCDPLAPLESLESLECAADMDVLDPLADYPPDPENADIGLFELTQDVMENGLRFREDSDVDVDNDDETDDIRLNWFFVIANNIDENLKWKLAPLDAPAVKFCPKPLNLATCVALLGIPDSEKANQFDGPVFSWSTVLVDGLTESPETLLWDPCHNGNFDALAPILCEVNLGGGIKVKTRSQGDVEGSFVVDFHFDADFNVRDDDPSGTLPLNICGRANLVFDSAGAGEPIDTTPPMFINVNGVPVPYGPLSIGPGAGTCEGGGLDLILNVERDALATAVLPCTDGEIPVRIAGTLINDEPYDGRPFEGTGTMLVHHCDAGAPVVSSEIADRVSTDGEFIDPDLDPTLDMSGNFSDPAGALLTFSATNLPPSLTITDDGIISETLTSFASAGGVEPGVRIYQVSVTASNGSRAVTDTFAWTVNNLDLLPLEADLPDVDGVIEIDAEGGQTGNLWVTFSTMDTLPDTDTPRYSVDVLPGGLSINSSTGAISGDVRRNPCGGGVQICQLITNVTADDGNGSQVMNLSIDWTLMK